MGAGRNAKISAAGAGFVALACIAPLSAQTPKAPVANGGGHAALQLGVPVAGIVKQIDVAQNAKVEAGQSLLEMDCSVLEADIKARAANAAAAEAVYERTRNGPRRDEVLIGEANVGVARARAEESAAAFSRAKALQEGVSTTRALVLLAQRDARISAAQLEDSQKRLDLLHAGSRAEDIAEALARRDAAAAAVDEDKARLAQCTVRAPVAGRVNIIATVGQYISTAVPVTLIELTPD